MNQDLEGSISQVCMFLNKLDVEYIIVGGAAVALNGYYRHSINSSGNITNKPDLDIWFNPTYENYFKLLNAIETIGQDVSDLRSETQPNPKKSYLKLSFDEFTLDFLPRLKVHTKFLEAFNRCEHVTLNGAIIPYLSLNDLIDDKRNSPRKKDIEDLAKLIKIRESKK